VWIAARLLACLLVSKSWQIVNRRTPLNEGTNNNPVDFEFSGEWGARRVVDVFTYGISKGTP